MGSMRDILPMPAMRAGQMSEVEMRELSRMMRDGWQVWNF